MVLLSYKIIIELEIKIKNKKKNYIELKKLNSIEFGICKKIPSSYDFWNQGPICNLLKLGSFEFGIQSVSSSYRFKKKILSS